MASFAPAPVFASRRGKKLLVPRFASLPAKCVRCAADATTPWRKKFYWHTPWLYLMILFPGLLIYAIVALIVRKQMELNVPLCDVHHAERKRYNILAAIFLIGFIPGGIMLGSYGSETLGWVSGVTMFFAGLVFLIRAGSFLKPERIDQNGGEFAGACEAFLQLLPGQSQT